MQLTLSRAGSQEYLMTARVGKTGVSQSRRVTVVIRAPEVKMGKDRARKAMIVTGYAVLGAMMVAAGALLIWVQLRGNKKWADEDARQDDRLKAIKEQVEIEELAERLARN